MLTSKYINNWTAKNISLLPLSVTISYFCWINPLFLLLVASPTSLQAFSSSGYSNQSRGGLPRFFSKTLPPSKSGVVCVEGDEFWHMTRVLRLGFYFARVELFNRKGGLIEGRIEKINHADFEALDNPKLVSPQTTQ
ncbi:hypothetical protein PHJA_002404700 [Phtheirospermum japonicum]|uniref:Uncharacterized protein n=1 Tax=Phtheirospermum japonicum TaxID=374723 RepID=A0A830CTY4_9LAMI|nr:hypothetical protein PHJA_002404700 [Phtheirospermum japonicum]